MSGEQATASAAPEQEQEAFSASASFSGARKGYVFKLGDQGLGYYLDKPLREATKEAAQKEADTRAAPPAVVKLNNNSLLKSLQKRGPLTLPSGGAAKKSKAADDKEKPAYLREMDKYKAMSCADSSKDGNRPLVK